MASDKKTRRLQELRGSDFELTKGQPDIRGWEIIDPTGAKVGKVGELIFDSRAHRVRYMVVHVKDNKELQLENRKVLVPIGLAQLDEADNIVILYNVTPYQLRALPKYDADDLGAKTERSIGTVFGRTHTVGANETADADVDNQFYEDELYNDTNLYKRQRRTVVPPATGSSSQTLTDTGHAQTVNDVYREKEPRRDDTLSTRADVEDLEADLDAADRREEVNDAFREDELRSTPATDAEKMRGETDEEYIRRARKDIDNP